LGWRGADMFDDPVGHDVVFGLADAWNSGVGAFVFG
jgi:hypothetical protein